MMAARWPRWRGDGAEPAAAGSAPSTAGPSTAGPSTAGPSTAGPSTAGPSTAGPAIASVRDALRRCQPLFVFAAVFGVAINVLMLTGPLYMLQIYDRVLASGSVQTLIALSVLVVAAYAALGLIDNARAQLAAKIGLRIERLLGERLVAGAWAQPGGGAVSQGSELLRDLDTYRGFIGGPGLIAAIDLPFAPLFIAVIFLLHPWLGLFALGAVLLLVALALLAQLTTRQRLAEAQDAARANNRLVLNVASAAEPVRALGMGGVMALRWRDERDALVTKQAVAADRAAAFKSATRATRFAVQSLILGLGAFLVLGQELSAGGMIAASIILGRALAPIEQALGAWGTYNAAKTARATIDAALAQFGADGAPTPTSPPPAEIRGEIAFDKLGYTPPNTDQPVLKNLTLRMPAGAGVGVVGPSGVGKSTLLRLMVGALGPTEGCVRLDGADIRYFDPSKLGRSLGYLPQEVGFLDGTVRENIARFRPGMDEAVYAAARRARAHDLIQKLPEGYETRLGAGGRALSAGQRQRVGLARALFGDPRVVVLDEPNSALDDVGEAALMDALDELSGLGVTIFIATHQLRVLESMEALLVLGADRSAMFGPRKAVLARLSGKGPKHGAAPERLAAPAPRPSGGGEGSDAGGA